MLRIRSARLTATRETCNLESETGRRVDGTCWNELGDRPAESRAKVRYVVNCGRLPRCAITGLMRCNNKEGQSATPSARDSNDRGAVKSNSLAAFQIYRQLKLSQLLDRISAGFAPRTGS